MSQSTLSRRYATALYQEAEATGVLDAVDNDVEMLRSSLDDNDELDRFFESPVIPSEKKENVLKTLLGDRVHALTLRFLRLLVRKQREDVTASILDAYSTLRDEQRGIVDVHVRVAKSLTDEDTGDLRDALEAKTGKSVRLHVEEQPELIGGMVIRIGDRVIDGSVRNQLSTLHERLRDTNVATTNGTS